MNGETVKLWCVKADNDFKAGSDELKTVNPATDTVCFHMQQCVEKYLKAFLVTSNVEIPRTHNIAIILQKCIEIEKDFNELKLMKISMLTIYAVQTRYPDDFYMPTVEESENAKEMAEKVRSFVGRVLEQR